MDFALLSSPSRWCFPAFIYVLCVLYLMIVTMTTEELPDKTKPSLRLKLLVTLGEALWGVIILYTMLMFCKYGYESLAWALLIAPLVIRFFKH